MKAELSLTPEDFEPDALQGKVAIAIDILRASTTIITALQNGCRQILPVAEVDTARKLARLQSQETTLLGGEREGKKLEGFQLGNSPREYTPATVLHKTLIFTTTNGTRLLNRTQKAELTLIAAFVNASQIAEYLYQAGKNFAILCAGTEGCFSLEDTVCAGMIFSNVYKMASTRLQINDLVLMSMILYQKFENNILNMLKLAQHGRYLTQIGFEADLINCSNVDSIPIIPVFRNGVVELLPSEI